MGCSGAASLVQREKVQLQHQLLVLGCVWFEDKGGSDMVIHRFRIWIFILSVWLDEWDEPFFCLVGWMRLDGMRILD
jgi:hypothetical protein